MNKVEKSACRKRLLESLSREYLATEISLFFSEDIKYGYIEGLLSLYTYKHIYSLRKGSPTK